MTILDATLSDDNGAYSLTVDASQDVMIRVRAELIGPIWNVGSTQLISITREVRRRCNNARFTRWTLPSSIVAEPIKRET